MTGRLCPSGLSRRSLLLAGLAVWGQGVRAASLLPPTRDLQAEIVQALPHPLVVLASVPGCPWCRIVREQHLAPLRAEQGFRFVEIDIGDDRTRLRNADGAMVTSARLAKGWRIQLAPTVLFLGAGGAEVAERLVGVPSVDYYAHTLAQRLQSAVRAG